MPKQSPVPDEADKPFWDACNEGRLVIQNCTACNQLQHPPEAVCRKCGSADHQEWKQVSGRGKVHGGMVVHDCRIGVMQPDQPFNVAIIELEEDPGVQLLSNLPGTTLDEIPHGATVQVEFQETPGNGQKVPEWRVIPPPWKR